MEQAFQPVILAISGQAGWKACSTNDNSSGLCLQAHRLRKHSLTRGKLSLRGAKRSDLSFYTVKSTRLLRFARNDKVAIEFFPRESEWFPCSLRFPLISTLNFSRMTTWSFGQVLLVPSAAVR